MKRLEVNILRRGNGRRLVWPGLWLLLSLVLPGAARAAEAEPSLTAVGDGQHLWLIEPTPAQGDGNAAGINLYYRHQADEAQALGRVARLSGLLAPGGASAADGHLWLVYSQGLVQTIEVLPTMPEGVRRFRRPRVRQPLPLPGVTLRASAGPWVLVRVETPGGQRRIEDAISPPEADPGEPAPSPDETASTEARQPEAPPPTGLPEIGPAPILPEISPEPALEQGREPEPDPDAPPPPPRSQTAPPDAAPVGPAAEAPEAPAEPRSAELEPAESEASLPSPEASALAPSSTPASFEPYDLLLHLTAERWRAVALPEDWPAGAPAWLVMDNGRRESPRLVARVGDQEARVYQQRGDGWQHNLYRLDDQAAGPWQAVLVGGQLVLARQVSQGADKLAVAATVLLPAGPDAEEGQVQPIGRLVIEQPPSQAWRVAPAGAELALFCPAPPDPARPQRIAIWTRMDLRGQVSHPPAPLEVQPPSLHFLNDPGQLLMVAVLVASLLVGLLVWRRESQPPRLELPEGVVLADLGRRFLAMVLDLLPGLAVAMVGFQLPMEGLARIWPGVATRWESLQAGLLAIGVFVVYTTVSEMLTARTPGKALLGLRVADLRGRPPHVWQVLARGLLKAFDLIVWYILPVLLLLGRHRQRLGDMVARTVVVSGSPTVPADGSPKAPKEAPPEASADPKDHDHEP